MRMDISGAFERGAIAGCGSAGSVAGADDMKPLIDRLLIVDDVIAALQTLARKVYEQGLSVHHWQRRQDDHQGNNGARAVAVRLSRAQE